MASCRKLRCRVVGLRQWAVLARRQRGTLGRGKGTISIWTLNARFLKLRPDVMASNQQFFAPRVYQPKTRISGHVALCPFKRTSEVNDSAVLPHLGLDYKFQFSSRQPYHDQFSRNVAVSSAASAAFSASCPKAPSSRPTSTNSCWRSPTCAWSWGCDDDGPLEISTRRMRHSLARRKAVVHADGGALDILDAGVCCDWNSYCFFRSANNLAEGN